MSVGFFPRLLEGLRQMIDRSLTAATQAVARLGA